MEVAGAGGEGVAGAEIKRESDKEITTMGTRADFYVGRGPKAEWLGSIAFDGYPTDDKQAIFLCTTETEYRDEVDKFLRSEDSATFPELGWPWPWEDSGLTDYSYAFDEGVVWASPYGHKWFDPKGEEPEDDEGVRVAIFPNMKDRMKIAHGKRSGLLEISIKP